MNFKKTEKIFDSVLKLTPPTLKLRAFGLAKIPLLFAVRPKVLELDSNSCKVLVPLSYVTKNHLGSMYFGALSIGADTAIGLMALEVISDYPKYKMAPIFKNIHGEFLMRAEKNVIFDCQAGDQIRAMIDEAIESGERVTQAIKTKAYSEGHPEEIVAEFELGLSLKAVKK